MSSHYWAPLPSRNAASFRIFETLGSQTTAERRGPPPGQVLGGEPAPLAGTTQADGPVIELPHHPPVPAARPSSSRSTSGLFGSELPAGLNGSV